MMAWRTAVVAPIAAEVNVTPLPGGLGRRRRVNELVGVQVDHVLDLFVKDLEHVSVVDALANLAHHQQQLGAIDEPGFRAILTEQLQWPAREDAALQLAQPLRRIPTLFLLPLAMALVVRHLPVVDDEREQFLLKLAQRRILLHVRLCHPLSHLFLRHDLREVLLHRPLLRLLRPQRWSPAAAVAVAVAAVAVATRCARLLHRELVEPQIIQRHVVEPRPR
mmetsp:Transcript_23596/g.62397  ORF Transcript_23596/g.62397 Transcript_23596/m.62397 type:complete len:221 (-) Transcript_23596:129-791(-)